MSQVPNLTCNTKMYFFFFFFFKKAIIFFKIRKRGGQGQPCKLNGTGGHCLKSLKLLLSSADCLSSLVMSFEFFETEEPIPSLQKWCPKSYPPVIDQRRKNRRRIQIVTTKESKTLLTSIFQLCREVIGPLLSGNYLFKFSQTDG